MIIGMCFAESPAAAGPRDSTQRIREIVAELHPGLPSNSSHHTAFQNAFRQLRVPYVMAASIQVVGDGIWLHGLIEPHSLVGAVPDLRS